jgi:cytochrome o ubiquinol oxidase operon protein cyoD
MTNVNHMQNDHGTLKSYIVGFILSIVLTIVPYYLVVQHVLPTEHTFILVVVLAVAQLFVQLYFFLHLSTKPSQRWNLMTFMFTCLVLFILVAGSLWIMWNMNYNMMEHIG